MPILRHRQEGFNKRKSELSKRDGLRHAIYSPKSKVLHEEYYRGEWRNDKKEGKGMSLNRNGWVYEGDWLNNKKHGYGVLSNISKDGRVRKCYAGSWMADKKHGVGSNWYKDGSYYEGTFFQNKREGEGRIWNGNGSYYQGTWSNDHYDGEGMLIQANGNRYEGQFVGGRKNGFGIFYYLDTGQAQRGIWKNDAFVRGTIEDTYWRQSALRPTPYPIPKTELAYWDTVLKSSYNIIKDESLAEKDSLETVCITRSCNGRSIRT